MSRQHAEDMRHKKKKQEEQRNETEELRARLNAYWKKIEALEEENRGKNKEIGERDVLIKTMVRLI